MAEIITILLYLLNILWWVIVINVVMSWLIQFNVINTHNDFVRSLWNGLERLLDPLYRPVRRLLPDFGGLDFAPLIVLLAIGLLNRLLWLQYGRALAYGL